MTNNETVETASKPLHGDWVYGLKISTTGTRRILARRWHAMELGVYDRVSAVTHETLPGVRVIDLYEANNRSGDNEPIELEDAIKRNSVMARFLLSVNVFDLVVLTSQLGYDNSGRVEIDRENPILPVPRVQYADVANSYSQEDLLDRHLLRVWALNGDPNTPLEPSRADDLFRQIITNTKEVN